MNRKQIYIFCIIPIILLVISCDERELLLTPDANISDFESSELWLGDTLHYFGSHFPDASPQNYFILKTNSSSSITIPSSDADFWSHSQISLVNNGSYSSGTIFLILAGDTSDARIISFINHPLLDTVLVSSTTFTMGNEFRELNERPVHEVHLTSDLIASKFEITQNIYELVMGENPSEIKGTYLPVHSISWEDAITFCNKLSLQYGFEEFYNLSNPSATFNINASGKGGWRLPTEAEWEYMCGAGSREQNTGYSNLEDGAWININSGYTPQLVGTKQANAFGMHDMLGNVAEFCTDAYIDDFYSATYSESYAFSSTVSSTISQTFTRAIIATNPVAYSESGNYVVRGGSCKQSNKHCRLTDREFSLDNDNFIGFRIVRTVYK